MFLLGEGFTMFFGPRPPAEIKNLPKSERERVTRAAWKRVRYHPGFLVMFGMLVLAAPLMAVLEFPRLVNDPLSTYGLFVPISAAYTPWLMMLLGLVNLATFLLFLFSANHLFRSALRQQLLDEGLQTRGCLECHSDFGDRAVRACPQCGFPALPPA